MACCHLTRRQLLRWSAVVAAAPLAGLLDGERAWALPRGADPTLVVHNLELVTLTETTAVLSWYTGQAGAPDTTGRLAPRGADTVVLLGTSPATLREVYRDDRATPYHQAEVTGLEPGQSYFYVAMSGGQPAVPSAFGLGNPAGTGPAQPGAAAGTPIAFTTPQPPPGRFLFALALANDVHIGETVAGLATTLGGQQVPPGISQREGLPPYPEVMALALTDDVRARGASLLLVAGDVTAEAGRPDVLRSRELLDRVGTLGTDYLVARGNHDRSHQGTTCRPSRVAGAGFEDCYRDTYALADTTWFSRTTPGGLHVVGLDTYDRPGDGGDNGMLSAEQFAWLREDLAREPERPTLVFGHHPVTVESSLDNLAPVRFDLDLAQAQQLEALYARTPGVVLHHAGHTHRNKRSTGTTATGVNFQEVAATKEYPGGFALLRVHSGGYALNFYKTRGDLAREWSERTRQEYVGFAGIYTNGTVADRNYVVRRDLSGLTGPGQPAGGSANGVGAGGTGGGGGGGAGGGVAPAGHPAGVAGSRRRAAPGAGAATPAQSAAGGAGGRPATVAAAGPQRGLAATGADPAQGALAVVATAAAAAAAAAARVSRPRTVPGAGAAAPTALPPAPTALPPAPMPPALALPASTLPDSSGPAPRAPSS